MKFRIFKTSESEEIKEIEIKDLEGLVELSKQSKWGKSDYSEGIIINGDTIEIYDGYRE